MTTDAELPRIIIAGVASGVGKTTITTGLMAALVARGLRVQGYKVGPDYIDPTYHRAATGRPSYNLDSWLSSEAIVHQRFKAGMRNADIAIIEGVMGLFDGRKQTRDTASTAAIARLLNAPVLLVIDTSHMGQSVAAIVQGFQQLDPRVQVVGVILNKVASAEHEATLRYALTEWTQVPVLGAIRRDAALTLPARHLGLVPMPEAALSLQKVRCIVEQAIDVETILQQAQQAGALPDMPVEVGTTPSAVSMESPVRMGLASDNAFSFYYPETLEVFAQMGFEIVPFSPLEDKSLPDACDILYFGGGFPEVYAAQLAANHAMLAHIRRAIARGMLVYAECGGYLYLGQACIDADRVHHTLVGALPYTFRMGKERAQLGYRELVTARESILGPAGIVLRGHEFHWSHLVEPLIQEQAAYILYEADGAQERREGYVTPTLFASYMHIPLAAHPTMIESLVRRCLVKRVKRGSE